MVALTTMLVLYTLYQSISEYLPHTSYLKMIDIWFIFCMVIPFLEVRKDDCGILTLFTMDMLFAGNTPDLH